MMNTIRSYIKENYKDFLSLVFFLICYALSVCLFLGGVADQSQPTDLNFPTFLILSIVNILMFGLFIFIEFRFFKVKLNYPLIIILTSLFVINLIDILVTPLVNTIGFTYPGQPESITVVITNEYKVEYILCFLLLLLNIYISFTYLIYHLRFTKGFAWLCCIIIIAALVFIVYSYVTEGETYKLFFENIRTRLVGYNPKSFTSHRNNYAAILLGGAFCSYAMNAVTKKRVFYLLGLFFCANTFFPMSRLCLVLSIVLTLMIFIYKVIVSWKHHIFFNLNLIFLAVFTLSLLMLIALNDATIKEYIERALLIYNNSSKARMLLWECTLSMINGIHAFIGLGHGYFNTAFTFANGEHIKMPHNLYLQTYGALGIVGVICLGALILYAIYKIVLLFKSNKDAAFISLIGLITVLSFYMFEG